MDEEGEIIRQGLEQELKWVQYRQKMLDVMEKKLFYMRDLAKQANCKEFTEREIEDLNHRLNDLALQIKALDSESRKAEDKKIL